VAPCYGQCPPEYPPLICAMVVRQRALAIELPPGVARHYHATGRANCEVLNAEGSGGQHVRLPAVRNVYSGCLPDGAAQCEAPLDHVVEMVENTRARMFALVKDTACVI
jgi:hypothetical protein